MENKAKQKAVEIFESMYENMPESLSKEEAWIAAKQCALIAVGEIIDCIYNEDFDGHLVDEIGANHFWDEVRTEIEKL